MPVFSFVYEVYDQDQKGPQLSLQALFAGRNVLPEKDRNPYYHDPKHPTLIQDHVGLNYPPQNIVLELEDMMKNKDVIVSPTLTLPAACTALGQDSTYKLIGAFRHTGNHRKKGNTSSRDLPEGLTYFCWNSQWYKISSTALKPTKVTEKEVHGAAADSGYVSNSFRYLYTLETAAP